MTKARLRFVINAPKDEHFSECIDDYNKFIQNLGAIHNSDVDSSKSPTMFRPIADNNDVTVLHPLVVVSTFATVYVGIEDTLTDQNIALRR